MLTLRFGIARVFAWQSVQPSRSVAARSAATSSHLSSVCVRMLDEQVRKVLAFPVLTCRCCGLLSEWRVDPGTWCLLERVQQATQ